MRIHIYRGLEQIGGCILSITSGESRVFIDMGRNLPGMGTKETEEKERHRVEICFFFDDRTNEAVFYTHLHEDHVGLFRYVPNRIPQYIGEGAKEILLAKNGLLKEANKAKQENIKKPEDISDLLSEESRLVHERKILEKFHTWKKERVPKPIRVGEITVTPFYNCHGVYDSYMLLIEAEGKRIWHMGDYREHGYLGKGLMPTLRHYAKDIDVLITEGTMLGYDKECIHESEVSKKMSAVMSAFKYVFVLCSATDAERLASVKNAAKATRHPLYVCSGMMKAAMRIFNRRESKASNGLFAFHPRFFDMEKDLEKVKKTGFVMCVGPSQIDRVKDLLSNLPESETLLIYSSWDGYYKYDEQIELNSNYKDMRDAFRNVVDIHTSGHADRKTIEKVINTVNPKKALIGIHKETSQSLDSLNISDVLKSKIVNKENYSF